MTTVPESEVRERAVERVQKRRDLGTHAIAFTVVNAMLIGVWAITGAGYFWPAWVMLMWAAGLILNAWDVFFRRPITEADIDHELTRMRSG